MLTEQQYQTVVFTAWRANSALTETLRAKEAMGCYPNWWLAMCQGLKIKSGLWSLSVADYSSEASVDIYNQLLDIGSTWFGGIALDNNAQTPGPIEVVNVPSFPEPIDIAWADFSTVGSPDGGVTRVQYYNTDWAGFNPFLALIQPGMIALELGIDYSLIPTGGFVLLPGGNLPGIFSGQKIRAENYAIA